MFDVVKIGLYLDEWQVLKKAALVCLKKEPECMDYQDIKVLASTAIYHIKRQKGDFAYTAINGDALQIIKDVLHKAMFLDPDSMPLYKQVLDAIVVR